jgi:Holliday junction DNA helicase RuvA
MITYLRGKLMDAQPASVVVDVQGLGYEAMIATSSFQKLPAVGSEIHLLTHLVIREDAHSLYGFLSPAERDLFRLLIHTVGGIGPRIALNVLGAMHPDHFHQAVQQQDVKRLSSISGIGRKTAERIVVELKDKLTPLAATRPTSARNGPAADGDSTLGQFSHATPGLSPSDQAMAGAIAGLIKLEMKPADAETAVRAAQAMLGEAASVDQLILAALKRIGQGA